VCLRMKKVRMDYAGRLYVAYSVALKKGGPGEAKREDHLTKHVPDVWWPGPLNKGR
jgi:hypothetical protein